METPKDILDNVKTRGDFRRVSESAQQQSSERQMQLERLTDLWLAMANTWSSFVSLYGETPLVEWAHGLAPFTDEQIQNGYLSARNAGLEFPPNLSVFIDYCRGQDDWESKRLHKQWQGHELPHIPEGTQLPPPDENEGMPNSNKGFMDLMREQGLAE